MRGKSKASGRSHERGIVEADSVQPHDPMHKKGTMNKLQYVLWFFVLTTVLLSFAVLVSDIPQSIMCKVKYGRDWTGKKYGKVILCTNVNAGLVRIY
jgi:hypothetical protein